MRDYSDDPDQPDPEYGVFGDLGEYEIVKELRKTKGSIKDRTVSEFNRNMIDIYNKGERKK